MSEVETLVQFSENESRLLGLKVGRCVSAGFNERELARQAIEGHFDIVRLTAAASDEDAMLKLDKTGIPYFFSGGITRFKTYIPGLPERDYIHGDLVFEEYDGTQNDLLLHLLKGTWGTYPIGYYRTPFMNKLVTKEQEILCVFEFYKKNNLKANNPSNTIMFIRHGDNYVGFFALNIIGDRLESHIGGIVEPYRSGGYFFDMQEYIRRFCVANKLQHFAFGARNENRRVQGIFQKFGYVAVDADNVFHLAPMMTHNSHSETLQRVISTTSNAHLQNAVFEACSDAWRSVIHTSPGVLKFQLLQTGKIIAGQVTATITFPVRSENENMLVAKLHDELHERCGTAYIMEQ